MFIVHVKMLAEKGLTVSEGEVAMSTLMYSVHLKTSEWILEQLTLVDMASGETPSVHDLLKFTVQIYIVCDLI